MKRNLRAPVLWVIAPALASAINAQAANAQTEASKQATEQPAGRDDNGADIVVTAQGRTQRLQDVPVSVTVASGKAIEQANITTLQDLTTRLPSVKIGTAPTSDFVTIRGVGSSLNLGFEQSVGTFVDGLYRGRARSTRSALFDVERVEVLKGPQTTFFGNNTIAGALNITTRKPSNRFEANGTAFLAPSTDEYLLEAGVTVPLTSTLSVRAVGRQSGSEGYIDNFYLGQRGPDRNDKIGRISLAWSPSEKVNLDARIDVGHMRDRGVNNSELIDCPPAARLGQPVTACARYLAANGGSVDDKLNYRSGSPPSFFNYDYVEGELQGRVDLGGAKLTLISGYFHHRSHLLAEALPIPSNKGGSVVGTVGNLPIDTDERYRQVSQEVRIASPESGFLSYTLGAYYAHSELRVDFYQGFYFAPFGAFSGGEYTGATPVAGYILNKENSNVASAFAAVTVRPIAPIRINLGLRYSNVRKHAFRSVAAGSAGLRDLGGGTFVPGNMLSQARLLPVFGFDQGNFIRPTRTDHKLMPTVSVQYDVAPHVMAYALYAKGFKAGGYSVLVNKSDFGPELVDNYEIGIKSSLFDRALSLNLSGFYSKYRNLQESTTFTSTSGAPIQLVANVASSTAKGIELGSRLRLVRGLSFTADLAYLDSRYDDYPNAPCTALQKVGNPTCVQNLAGARRAFAPEWSGSVGAEYETHIGSAFRLNFSGNVYFSSKFFQQPVADQFLQQSGYGKIDARIAFGSEDGKWDIAIVGKNLTDKTTASYRQITVSFGTFQALADPPRTIGLQATFRR